MKRYINVQTVIAFTLGACLFSAIPIKAAVKEYILQKAEYKVVINNSEYTDSEHPILEYQGTTYAPLRSMLSAAGLNINWNSELNQAEVASKTISVPTPISTPEPYKNTTYKGMQAIEYNGSIYLLLRDTFLIYKIEMQYNNDSNTLKLTRDSKTQVVELSSAINAITYEGATYINKIILDNF